MSKGCGSWESGLGPYIYPFFIPTLGCILYDIPSLKFSGSYFIKQNAVYLASTADPRIRACFCPNSTDLGKFG